MTKKRADRIRQMGYEAYMSGDLKLWVRVHFMSSRRTCKAFMEGWRAAEKKFIKTNTYGGI